MYSYVTQLENVLFKYSGEKKNKQLRSYAQNIDKVNAIFEPIQ